MEGLNNRAIIIISAFFLVGIIYIGQLYYIQVYDASYKFSADSNTQRIITQYPSRGLVFDRNGRLVISNQPVYDIMIVPRDLEPFDTLDFCHLIGITLPNLRNLFSDMRRDIKSRKISSYKPSVFIKQVSAERYGQFQEKLIKFPGFFTQRRTLRKYEYPNAAHVLGYISEVTENMIDRDPYYISGDYSGFSGLELSYEQELRGKKGAKVILVDVHGREKGSYRQGRYDTTAVVGKNIYITLDMELQQYAELLMVNKIGSIVAIEPETGEVLAMVSIPTYDPSLLVGRLRSSNYPILENNPLKPLFNRPLQAMYPPGSTFKTLQALIGLQEGVININTRFGCSMGYHAGGLTVGCHSHASPLDLLQSIQQSCNGYYCNVFRTILDNPKYKSSHDGLDVWKNYLVKFGLGYKLGIDFFNEKRGLIPNSDYYNKIYNSSWNSLTVISLAIGQGELLVTPLQMANMSATIANDGYFYTPHIVKDIEDSQIPSQFKEKHETDIDTANYEIVKDGMELVVLSGTARVAQIEGITVCGKTGTAQNPHGKDHSIFIAFAPKDHPKIAISVYVENAGFGATYAAPIASLLIEKYLKREIDPKRKYLEDRLLSVDLIHNAPY